MPTDRVQRLLRLAVMVALPALACQGWYTADALPAARSAWAIPAMLALPLALVGTVGWVTALRAAEPSRLRTAFWAVCAAAPIGLWLWLRA